MHAVMKRLPDTKIILTSALREQLSQHLAGTVLAAGALCARLRRRQAPEATEAAYLLDMLKTASRQLNCLVRDSNIGKLDKH
jgi:hypothetical protein